MAPAQGSRIGTVQAMVTMPHRIRFLSGYWQYQLLDAYIMLSTHLEK